VLVCIGLVDVNVDELETGVVAPRGDASMIRLRPSEPGIADDLASFLSRHDCRAEVAEDGTVMVELPHVLHRAQARMELELCIRLWQALRGVGIAISSISP
jgi:hypothetical protein